MTTNDLAWVPDECSLPTTEQPLRLAEFDDLFATALRGIETVTPTHARLRLTGPDGLATTVRSLAARETECCSFFEFRISPDPAVPPSSNVPGDLSPRAGIAPTDGTPPIVGVSLIGGDVESLTLDVEVPPAHVDVLSALLTRASSAQG